MADEAVCTCNATVYRSIVNAFAPVGQCDTPVDCRTRQGVALEAVSEARCYAGSVGSGRAPAGSYFHGRVVATLVGCSSRDPGLTRCIRQPTESVAKSLPACSHGIMLCSPFVHGLLPLVICVFKT